MDKFASEACVPVRTYVIFIYGLENLLMLLVTDGSGEFSLGLGY